MTLKIVASEGARGALIWESAVDLVPYYETIVLIHVVGVLVFLIAHGISMYVLVTLRGQHDPDAVRRRLELSRRSLSFMYIGLLAWLIAGLLAGFVGNWWTSGQYWIWASVVIVFFVMGSMTPLGRFYLNRVRAAVGVDPRTGKYDSAVAVDAGALDAALASGRPMLLLAIGLGGLIALFWLMLAKPF
jgi:hypothetical protein